MKKLLKVFVCFALVNILAGSLFSCADAVDGIRYDKPWVPDEYLGYWETNDRSITTGEVSLIMRNTWKGIVFDGTAGKHLNINDAMWIFNENDSSFYYYLKNKATKAYTVTKPIRDENKKILDNPNSSSNIYYKNITLTSVLTGAQYQLTYKAQNADFIFSFIPEPQLSVPINSFTNKFAKEEEWFKFTPTGTCYLHFKIYDNFPYTFIDNNSVPDYLGVSSDVLKRPIALYTYAPDNDYKERDEQGYITNYSTYIKNHYNYIFATKGFREDLELKRYPYIINKPIYIKITNKIPEHISLQIGLFTERLTTSDLPDFHVN